MIQLKDFAETKFTATEEEIRALGLTYTNQDITFISQKPTNLFFINDRGFIKRHMNGNSEQPNTRKVELKEIADSLKNGKMRTIDVEDLKVELFRGHPNIIDD